MAGNGASAHTTPARVRVVTITVAALDWVNVGGALAQLGVHDVTSVILRPARSLDPYGPYAAGSPSGPPLIDVHS
jgi:hypothetical protein